MVDDQRRRSKRYPELEHFAAREDADRAVHDWKKRLMRSPRFWLGLVLYTAVVGGIVMAILISIRRRVLLPSSMFVGIVAGVTGVSGSIAINWFWRHRLRRYLREQLVARGIPVCVKCGYDLRGQSVPRCPECGTPFDVDLIGERYAHDGR